MGNAQAGTLNGWPFANGSHHNAGSSSTATLFGTNLLYPYGLTEATLNPNKRKRESAELGLPPTFAGNRTSGLMSRSSQPESSTVVTTSRYPAAQAPTPAAVRAPAPAMLMDRGKQPMQASGSGSVPARREPNPRFSSFLLNYINSNNGR